MESGVAVTKDCDLVARLIRQATCLNCPKNRKLFVEGETAHEVFYVQEGAVKLTAVSPEGKEGVIAVLGAGNFFGEVCLLTDYPRRVVTATTLVRSTLMRLEKSVIASLLHKDAAFRQSFVAYLLSRNRRVEDDFADQLFNTVEKRLARILLLLCHSGNGANASTITIKITHEMLAQMIGTTRSRVSYFMNKFKRSGLIDYHQGLRLNRPLLTSVLNE